MRRGSGISRSAEDIRFSKMIRERDNWACRRCGAQHTPTSTGLHCAHHYTRRTKATRFDEFNCLSLCYGCHSHLDSHPIEKRRFWVDQIGEEAFHELTLRAHGAKR